MQQPSQMGEAPAETPCSSVPPSSSFRSLIQGHSRALSAGSHITGKKSSCWVPAGSWHCDPEISLLGQWKVKSGNMTPARVVKTLQMQNLWAWPSSCRNRLKSWLPSSTVGALDAWYEGGYQELFSSLKIKPLAVLCKWRCQCLPSPAYPSLALKQTRLMPCSHGLQKGNTQSEGGEKKESRYSSLFYLLFRCF